VSLRLRRVIPLALIGAALVPAGAQAETRYLDAYDRGRDGYAGPLRMVAPLQRGRPYVALVRGTASFFMSGSYSARCGRPLARPIFRSPGRRNRAVGIDSEFTFAVPANVRRCRPVPPYRNASFQLRTKRSYHDPYPLGPALTAPTRSHAYRYPMMGHGVRPSFRLRDPNTRDNYGRFRITVRRARAVDCANSGFAGFGFASEADCAAAVARP
jgi:hypothetical protein